MAQLSVGYLEDNGVYDFAFKGNKSGKASMRFGLKFNAGDIALLKTASSLKIGVDFSAEGNDYNYETEIIAASVRNPIHVTDCALAGADIATVPYSVIEQMTKHPLTDQGIEKFQADYKAVFGY